MKKEMKRILPVVGVIAAGLALTAVRPVSAYEPEHYEEELELSNPFQNNTPVPVVAEVEEEIVLEAEESAFVSHTGEVVSIEDEQIVLDNAILSISENTFVLGEIAVGETVTFWVKPNAPVGRSYPPFYGEVTAIVVESDDILNHKLDIFEYSEAHERLVSRDGNLAITIGEHTQVLDLEGNAFTGEDLSGRFLLVVYGISTRSIPAQTTPSKIIAFPLEDENATHYPSGILEIETGEGFENVVTLPLVLDPSEIITVQDAPIILNGNIGVPENFVERDNTIYVPLRAVIEALGGTVGWNPVTATITLELDGETFAVQASVIIENRTYVPLSFFREVLGFNNAYFEGGHVQINNEEVMQ